MWDYRILCVSLKAELALQGLERVIHFLRPVLVLLEKGPHRFVAVEVPGMPDRCFNGPCRWSQVLHP